MGCKKTFRNLQWKKTNEMTTFVIFFLKFFFGNFDPVKKKNIKPFTLPKEKMKKKKTSFLFDVVMFGCFFSKKLFSIFNEYEAT